MNIPFFKFSLSFIFLFTGIVCFSQKIKYTEKYADSLIELGQFDKALDACNTMLKSDKKNAAFLRSRALCYLKKEDSRNAISEYQKIISKSPDCAACMMNLAKAYTQLEKKDSARLWINKAIALDGSKGEFYIARASFTLGSTKDSTANLNDLNKGIELQPLAANYVLRARYYYGLGYLPMAKENVYSALKLDENNFDACFLNFLIQSAFADQPASARYADKCFKIAPSNPKSVVLKAVMAASKGDTTGKRRIIDSVCAQNDKVPVLHLFRSLFYRNIGMLDAFCGSINYGFTKLKTNEDTLTYAIFGREAGAICDPKDLTYYTSRISGVMTEPEELEKGIQTLKQAQIAIPSSCIIPFQLSYFYTRQNKYDEAYGEIQKSFGNYNRVEVFKFLKLYTLSPEAAVAREKEFRFNQMFILNQCLSVLYPDAKDKTGYGILMGRALDSSLVLINSVNDNYVKESYFLLASYCFFLTKNEEKENYFIETAEKLNVKIPASYLLRAMLVYENACPGTFEEKFSANPFPFLNIKSKALKPDLKKLEKALADVELAIKLSPESNYFYYLRGMLKWNLGKKDFCADIQKAYELKLDKTVYLPPAGCKL